MSSTYAHYQGPSSLPSDYAIISALNANRGDLVDDDERDADSLSDSEVTHLPGQTRQRKTRRSSQTANGYYYRPTNPTIGVRNDMPSFNRAVSETTPLLSNPPVPRIEEEADASTVSSDHPVSPLKIFFDELCILVRYAFPIFGTHILEYSLVVVSVVSIGHISTTALAAISLGSMTASVSGFSIIQGMVSALDTLLPSAWTSPQPHLVGLWSQRMTVVMTVCLIPTFFIWFNAKSILLFLKQEPEVANLAAIYLRWVSLGLPAYAFNCISRYPIRRYFQSQGLFAVPTRIVTVVAPINALLNWLLVWGPAPVRLGFIGAPIATALSFNLISLLSILYGIFYAPKTAWYPLSMRMFTSLGVLFRLGLSGVIQTASEWWAWELAALAASLLGPTALATQSVVLVSASTIFQAPFALSVATSVRIGNLLGQANAARAKLACNTSILLSITLALFTSSFFLAFRNQWALMFNDDPEVVRLTASIMPLVGLFQVFDGVSAVTGGILRSRGKQFLGAMLNLSAYYIFGIPLGVYLAFGTGTGRGMGLHGLWLGLTFSLVYCALFGTWFCVTADWDKEVTKVQDRLKDEGGKKRQRDLV
ncbi:MATE efflux family protein [Crepidotus variabilis]|uniref:MATE efflux family protein n=1 Tax=Crepidotus variabilis TaxID=179855 RepID=A0A9P6JMJ0_9AGAR|nr:MATE efflux family protein [Crepidotus variabilis]